MKKLTLTLSLAALALLAGCNTVKGMGQDIQKAGEKIEGAAKK
jgi:predicted small secreted protein